MSHFTGFADANGAFFKALAKNQSRDWFLAHKAEYEAGWQEPMKLLMDDLHAALDRAYTHVDLDEPKVFRIFRDVRFSKDKTPYKTHVAGCIPTRRAGKVTESPIALYVHFGTDNVVASGLYVMDSPSLARFRAAVADDARGKELAKILAKLEKGGFSTDIRHDDALKKVPKGFDPDHPRAAILKRKSFGVSYPAVPTKLLASRALLPWLVDHAKKVVPLVEWLVFATA